MRFISDFRPIEDACLLLDALIDEGPCPQEFIDRIEAWADDDASPGVAVEICLNGERYHATEAMLGIIVDLMLYRAGVGYATVTG